MKKNQDKPADAAELRRRAEERLGKKQKSRRPAARDLRAAEDTAPLIHELQVHQIELEMQNEELKQARDTADALLIQYTDLYDFAPAGYLTLDREGAIRQLNLTGARLLGVERSELVNRRFGQFVAESDRRAFSDFLAKVFDVRTSEACEVMLAREENDPRVVRIEAAASEDGQECRAVVMDITDRVQMEEVMRSTNAILEAQSETSMDGILAVDNQGKSILFNARFSEMWSIPREVLDTRDDGRMLHHVLAQISNPDEFLAKVRRLYDHRDERNMDEVSLKDGRILDRYSSPLVDSSGKHLGRIWFFRDVTERKRAEESMREVQERLALAISGTQVGMFDWDLAKGKMLWTETHEAIFGYAPATTTTTTTTTTTKEHDYRRWADRVHPDDLARVEGQMRICARERRPFQGQYRIIWPDKSEHWIETKGVFFHAGDGEAVRMVGIALDITDRLQAEERHSTVVKTAMDGFWVIDTQSRILEANDALCQMTGYGREELLRMSISDLEAIETPEETAERIRGIIATGKVRFETRLRRKDGRIIDTEASVTYLGESSKLMFAFARDITEHKRAQKTLQESEERFRTLVDAVTDYAYRVTVQDGRVAETTHGPGCLGVTGYSPEEFHTQPDLWLQLVHSENQPAVLDQASKLLSGLKAGPLEHRIIHKNGATRWVRNTAVLRFDHHGQYIGYEGMIQDVTEYRKIQEQLIQSQKMEAIGQLAGGVAHDFRNQLTIIKGFGEMLLRRFLVKEEGIEKLHQILRATDRSTLLTGHLLAFSRKQTLQPEQVDLAELIADIGRAIPRLTGEDVRVHMDPSPTPCVVEIDPGQFQQALINLVTNGRDAMPKGGSLTIATSRRELDDGFLKKHPDAKPGAYAAVAVTDTGCGMDEATLARVFEPFFTTKEVGQGTGLGLAMAYGFVKQSGGIVEVKSQPGKGSTFTLFFPEYKGHDKTRREGSDAREDLPGGTETILVVEDEEPVRQMLVESLRESGYAVLHADNAAHAAAEIGRAGDKIDMLITDVVMPGGSGLDLAQMIQKARPEMPVLYVSGYAERDLKKRGVTIAPRHMLTKPCSHETLLTKVRQLLDGGQRKTRRKRHAGK